MGAAIAGQYTIEDAPAQSRYTVEDEPSSPLTANPKNEGVYTVKSGDQTLKVPYSQVGPSAQQGYQLSPEDAGRYAKDASFANKGPSFRDRVTAIQPHQMPHSAGDVGREAAKGFENLGGAFLTPFLKPVDTAKGVLSSAWRSSPPGTVADILRGKPTAAQELVEGLQKQPLETAESLAGQGVALEAIPAGVGVAKSIGRNTLDAMAGTSPRVTKNLVKETTAANSARDTYSDTHAAIETAREKALKVGNEKYSTVNTALNNFPADMEQLTEAYAEAAHSFGEAQNYPPIIKRLEGAMREPLSYKDEQLLYSELGKELSKGTLPGSTYHAYDVLQEAVGKDMQRIADSQNMGPQLSEARNHWRRMKQTFGKPQNSTDVATQTLTGASPEVAEASTRANRIRMMGSFDPEIPGKFSKLDSLTKDAKGKIDRPEKIGSEEVKAAKTKSLADRADAIRNRGGSWANTFVILDAIRNAVSGNIEGIGKDIAVRAIFGSGKVGLAKMLENPGVVNFLTQATERDVAQIPPELKGDFPKIVQAAKAKGINVSPALLGTALAPKKRVAATLTPQ